MTTVLATPGQGPDRPQEVSYSDTKVIGNGSFGVVYQARLLDTAELVAIKKVLQDKRFKASPPVSRFTYDGWRPLVPMSWAVSRNFRATPAQVPSTDAFSRNAGGTVALEHSLSSRTWDVSRLPLCLVAEGGSPLFCRERSCSQGTSFHACGLCYFL